MSKLALNVQSAAGSCGVPFEVVDSVDGAGAGSLPPGAAGVPAPGLRRARRPLPDQHRRGPTLSSLRHRPGIGRSVVGPLRQPPGSYKATRQQLNLVVAPQDAGFTPGGVVNAATFTAGIAPGGLISIFGTGLSGRVWRPLSISTGRSCGPGSISVPGERRGAADIQPGEHTVHVHSAFGDAQQQVAVSSVAPQIFLIGNPPTGAVVNQDNTINGPTAPLTADRR